MEKIKTKDNSLIKKKGLIQILKTEGIERIEPDAIDFIQEEIKNILIDKIKIAHENMIINGRKTLKKDDILELNKGEEYPEI